MGLNRRPYWLNEEYRPRAGLHDLPGPDGGLGEALPPDVGPLDRRDAEQYQRINDKYVTIVGHVTRRISDEEYWFTDGSGSIRLDSENFDLPIGRRILIGGRIDQAYLGFGHIEVDVRRWHYAPLPAKVVVVPRLVPMKHTDPVPAPHQAAAALAPAPEPAPAPVMTTPPPPAAPPTPTTSTTMNPAPVMTPPVPVTPAPAPSLDHPAA